MRVKMVVAYDGTKYSGWQIQPNGVTIEQKLNEALQALLGEDIRVTGASRTDAGVHSLGNVCIFDTDTRMPAEKISYALNQRLPEDIVVQDSCEVPDTFHPRFSRSRKTYEVGAGEFAPQEMQTILDACDRSVAGPTAPAHGLTMIGLEYE